MRFAGVAPGRSLVAVPLRGFLPVPLRMFRKLGSPAVFCLCALAAFAVPAFAQQHAPTAPPLPGENSPEVGSSNMPAGMAQPDVSDPFDAPRPSTTGLIIVNAASAHMLEAETCNSWTDSGMHSPTVSVGRLQVPDKASGEFQRACSSLKAKRYPDAEEHVRKALGIYPEYAAGWVLLGQILDGRKQEGEASKACSHATTVDPKYVAPYLCLAEFASRSEDWKEVSRLSDQALAIDPTSNAYAFYYSAAASFHLEHLPDAEISAKAAAQLDPWHKLPQVHLLLASIDAAKNDPHGEISELKEFLKVASNSPDAAVARVMLRQVENPPPAPTPSAGALNSSQPKSQPDNAAQSQPLTQAAPQPVSQTSSESQSKPASDSQAAPHQ